MNAFIVQLENRPGTLAQVAEALGAAGVNITTGAGMLLGLNAGFGFVAEDEAKAAAALEAAGIGYRSREIVQANLADSPGTLGALTRRLGDAGVNIELFLPIAAGDGQIHVAFAVNDAETAARSVPDPARPAS